ncbi:MAG: hypothetical protein WA194_01120 [Patescibacteria group bacterium]
MDFSIGKIALGAGFLFLTLIAVFLFVMTFAGIASKEGEPWDAKFVDKLVFYPLSGLAVSMFPIWIAHGYSLLAWVFGASAPWIRAEILPVSAYWSVAFVVGGLWTASLRSGRKNSDKENMFFFAFQTAWFFFAYPALAETLS